MSAEVVSLKDARVDRDARVRASIDSAVAKGTADMERWYKAFVEWKLKKTPAERAQVAHDLAGEIATRAAPIAAQFKNFLHDALVLYVAEAQEAGEDLTSGLLLGLTLTMADERYAQIAGHIAREPIIRSMGEAAAAEYRRANPSPIDAARDRLFEHYVGLRKK